MQIVQEARLPEGGITFPLRQHYLEANKTVEGALKAAGKDDLDNLANNPLVEPLRVGSDDAVEDAPGTRHIVVEIFKGPLPNYPGQSSCEPMAPPNNCQFWRQCGWS